MCVYVCHDLISRVSSRSDVNLGAECDGHDECMHMHDREPQDHHTLDQHAKSVGRTDVQVPVEQCNHFGYENTSRALPSSRRYSLARRTNLFVFEKHPTRPLQDSPSRVHHETSSRGCSNVDAKQQ